MGSNLGVEFKWVIENSRDYDFARDCGSFAGGIRNPALINLRCHNLRGTIYKVEIIETHQLLRCGMKLKLVQSFTIRELRSPFMLVQYVGHSFVEWVRDVTKDSLPEPSRRSYSEASRSYL